jgi:hypothetical protein
MIDTQEIEATAVGFIPRDPAKDLIDADLGLDQ